ncbi:MAG: hypothetical protein AAFP69_15360, partial [Planctomycetota bacterium]
MNPSTRVQGPSLSADAATDTLQADHTRPDDSAAKWFARGFAVGILLVGTSNALSFFVLSRGWGSLLGNRALDDEVIGVPLVLWNEADGIGIGGCRAGARGGPDNRTC